MLRQFAVLLVEAAAGKPRLTSPNETRWGSIVKFPKPG
jgi:hypothetical protein